jgi:hypothetical protein
MLMPAAVLIVIVLGAIAVDLSMVRMAKVDLLSVAGSAANDAATYGAEPEQIRGIAHYRIFDDRADEAVRRTLATHPQGGRITVVRITITPERDQVTVELEMPVDYIFAKAIGSNDRTTVRAFASASADQR